MVAEPKLSDAHLQALCDIIGDTDTGLTGSEIGRCLVSCNIGDPYSGATKRHRLFGALRAKQDADVCANGVLAFVKHVMDPVRYVGQTVEFEMRRSALNVVLAFCGVVLGEDGGLHRAKTARTVSEAEASASLLRKALVERRVHEDVLKFCRAELVADNYFHAVFEATKSVAEKLPKGKGARCFVDETGVSERRTAAASHLGWWKVGRRSARAGYVGGAAASV